MSTESKQSFETLIGGAVTTIHRKPEWGRQEVFVRQLPIEDYPKLLGLMDDEGAQLELYCLVKGPPDSTDKTHGTDARWVPVEKGWAKTLTPAAHDSLMEKAEELNRDFFGRWLRRRMAKMEAIRPGLTEEMVRGASGSRDSAPKLRPIAGLASRRPGDTV